MFRHIHIIPYLGYISIGVYHMVWTWDQFGTNFSHFGGFPHGLNLGLVGLYSHEAAKNMFHNQQWGLKKNLQNGQTGVEIQVKWFPTCQIRNGLGVSEIGVSR